MAARARASAALFWLSGIHLIKNKSKLFAKSNACASKGLNSSFFTYSFSIEATTILESERTETRDVPSFFASSRPRIKALNSAT